MIRQFVCFVAVFLGLSSWAGEDAKADTTLGRWCDRMLPNVPRANRRMTLTVKNDGMVVLHSHFGDGSKGEEKLRELGGDIYAVVDSRWGDKYRIALSSGELQILDNDGLIRTAKRLENKPTPGECR